MAHFAQLDENNTVVNVVKVLDSVILDENGNESEEVGVNYLKTFVSGSHKWVQTSYNNNFRFRYAPIGGFYHEGLDAFFYAKPFPSWTMNETECTWEAPVSLPPNRDGYFLSWNEDIKNWEYVEIPPPPPPEEPVEENPPEESV
jgi:hypothetical protein